WPVAPSPRCRSTAPGTGTKITRPATPGRWTCCGRRQSSLPAGGSGEGGRAARGPGVEQVVARAAAPVEVPVDELLGVGDGGRVEPEPGKGGQGGGEAGAG